MVALIFLFLNLIGSLLKSKSRLEAENTALRHQLTMLQRKVCVLAAKRLPATWWACCCAWQKIASTIPGFCHPVVPENSIQLDSRGEGVSAHHPK